MAEQDAAAAGNGRGGDFAGLAYDAFISYSQRGDKAIAQAIRTVIQTAGKPWWQVRSLNVFLDATSLSAAPGLWGSIAGKLDRSRFLILLASPEAAASSWVDREVAHFVERNGAGADRVLIGLTAGELAWDAEAGDFTWGAATPLPPTLRGRFGEEPLWVDLRPFRADPGRASKSDQGFLHAALGLAAAIKGVDKAELYSDELRQQRRALRLAYGAAAVVAVLGVGAGVAAWVAVEQARQATRNFGIASDTIAGMVGDVTGELAHVEGMRTENLRKILTRVETAIDSLRATAPDDPGILASHAEMLDQIGTVYDEKGDPQSALRAMEDRLAIAERLAVLDPSPARDVEVGAALASVAHEKLALGDLAGADAAIADSLGRLRALDAGAKSDAAIRTELAWALLKFGAVRSDQGRGAEAIAAFEEGVGIYRTAVAADPSDSRARYLLGWALDALGKAEEAAGDRTAALAAFDETVTIRRDLAAGAPDDISARANVAWALTAAARVRSDMGDAEGARADLDEAVRIYSGVTGADPENAQALNGLLVARLGLADIAVAAGRPSAALGLYREAVALGRRLALLYPDATLWRRNLSVALAAAARYTASVEGDDEAALALANEGVDVARGMVAHAPQADEGRMALAARLVTLGDLHRGMGEPDAAAAAYREAAVLRTALAEAAPDDLDRVDSLSIVLERSGIAALSRGDAEEALGIFTRTLAMRQRLVVEDPASAYWKSGVGWAHEWIGDTLSQLGRGAEAVASYRAAAAVFAGVAPGNLTWARRVCSLEGKVAGVLAHGGDREGARDAYAQAAACFPKLDADGSEDHAILGGIVVEAARMLLRQRDVTDDEHARFDLADTALGHLNELRDMDEEAMTAYAWALLDEAEQAVVPGEPTDAGGGHESEEAPVMPAPPVAVVGPE